MRLEVVPEARLSLPAESRGLVVARGRVVVAIDADLYALDVATKRLEKVVRLPEQVRSLRASPELGLVCALESGDVSVIGNGHISSSWSTGRGPIRAMAVSGKSLATSHGDESAIDVWDIAERRRVRTIDPKRGRVFALALSPNARHIAVGANSAHVDVFDLLDHQQRPSQVLRGRRRCIYAVKWLDDTRLAAVPFGRTVFVWDAVAGKKLGSLVGRSSDAAKGIGISIIESRIARRGNLLATAGLDRVVRFHSLDTLTHSAVGKGHGASIWALAFLDDGRLLSASRDGQALLWRL